MAAPQVEQPSESLKDKTWVLKVSINCACEGCKKKVKKILQNVRGVNGVDVDIKQQKVTVTGNVSADALIKKLTKSGRHAQLWPLNADQSDKKSNNKVKQGDPQTNKLSSHGDGKEIQKAVKVEAVQVSAEPTKITQGSTKISEETAGGEGVKEKEEPEAKKPVTESAGNQSPPPPADIQGEQSKDPVVVVAAAGAAGGEKKKKKGQNGKFAEGEPSSGAAAAASTGSINHNPAPPPVSSPPRHQGYQHPPPPHYYAPPPAYAVSYNTAPPSSSYTASHYVAPPPYTHAYTYPSRETAPPPSDIDSYPRQPLDSFEMLSDENPNGCSIM